MGRSRPDLRLRVPMSFWPARRRRTTRSRWRRRAAKRRLEAFEQAGEGVGFGGAAGRRGVPRAGRGAWFELSVGPPALLGQGQRLAATVFLETAPCQQP